MGVYGSETYTLNFQDFTQFSQDLPLVDLVVSNPPYISQEEKSDLDLQVVKFESHKALFSDFKGWKHTALYLKKISMGYLKIGGYVMLELDPLQIENFENKL